MRRLAAAATGVTAIAAAAPGATTADVPTSPPPAQIRSWFGSSHWQVRATTAERDLRKMRRLAYKRLRWVKHLQRSFRLQVRLGGASGLEKALLCIHSFEGSWTDGGSPYYGGMQMDSSFQSHYGPEFVREYGSADNWTPSMQLAVAERAYLSGRGFGPWPKTRLMCGV